MANWGWESEKTAWRRRTWQGKMWRERSGLKQMGAGLEGSLCVSVSLSFHLCPLSPCFSVSSLSLSLSFCFSLLSLPPSPVPSALAKSLTVGIKRGFARVSRVLLESLIPSLAVPHMEMMDSFLVPN